MSSETENPLIAGVTAERRFVYEPDTFLGDHARFYTQYFVRLHDQNSRDLEMSPDWKESFRWALSMFSDALTYPSDPATADRMRELGIAAETALRETYRETATEIAPPHDYLQILREHGEQAVELAVRWDLTAPGGIDQLRWYGLKGGTYGQQS